MTYFILLTSIRSFDVTTVNPNKLSKKFHRGAHKTELDISKLFHPDNQEIFVFFFFIRRLQKKKRFYLNGTTNPGGCAARQLGTTGLNGAPAGEQLPLPTY
jgi:hypothetical protein